MVWQTHHDEKGSCLYLMEKYLLNNDISRLTLHSQSTICFMKAGHAFSSKENLSKRHYVHPVTL